MAVLLIAEHNNATLGGATAKALSAAKQINSDVHVLVAGHSCAPAAEAASKLSGATKVLVADAPHLANGLAEEVAATVVALASGYDTIMAPATASGKNVLPPSPKSSRPIRSSGRSTQATPSKRCSRRKRRRS
jgi:electron transfer flavoprotein alpha subunit